MLHELLRGKVLLSQSLFDLEERIDACQGGVALPLVGETSLASKNFRRACAQQPTCITPGWLPNSV